MSDNPFLLPPGSRKPAAPPAAPPVAPTPVPAAPSPPPAADPSHYIAVPASVESVTHRVARPAHEPATPPAAEPAGPPTAPAAAAPPAPAASAPEAVAEDTRVAPPRRWALVLPDGARVSLDGPVLLGRDPAGISDRPGARLVPVVDTGKTVSKTHALLEPAAEGVRVRDLHSTNGVAIDTAAGRQVLTAGGEGIAAWGATVMLGSFAVRIEG